MPRVTKGTKGHRRHKKILSYAKGYVGGRGLYRQGRETVEKGLTYAYRDRKVKKRDFRRLWIVRVSAACRMRGIRYSELIYGLQKASIILDRKSLSEIAIHDPETFTQIVEIVKTQLAAAK